jgi:hypothetical protein
VAVFQKGSSSFLEVVAVHAGRGWAFLGMSRKVLKLCTRDSTRLVVPTTGHQGDLLCHVIVRDLAAGKT